MYHDLPMCPFLWLYNNFIFKIEFAQKVTQNELQLDNSLCEIIKQYECDFYIVEQEILNTNEKNIKFANISFHSWLFSKLNTDNDMTNKKLNIEIMSALFTYDNKIKQYDKYGIEINSFAKRRVHIHNNRLSPKFDNTVLLETKPEKFISICVEKKTNKCCVTLHKLNYL